MRKIKFILPLFTLTLLLMVIGIDARLCKTGSGYYDDCFKIDNGYYPSYYVKPKVVSVTYKTDSRPKVFTGSNNEFQRNLRDYRSSYYHPDTSREYISGSFQVNTPRYYHNYYGGYYDNYYGDYYGNYYGYYW